MLPPQHFDALKQIARQLNPAQLAWVSNYFAELRAAPAAAPGRATLLVGSQNGNGKAIADSLRRELAARGLEAEVLDMADYKTARLKKERFLLLIVSTHGEGEPPDSALAFYDFLHSARAPRLPGLKYAVLALGDSSYRYFCKTGRDLDARLGGLGAHQLLAVAECDTDYEREAKKWRRQIGELLPEAKANLDITGIETAPAVELSGRENPFAATVVHSVQLTADPARRAFHLELSLEESGLSFQPGDCLGVWAQNPPRLARQVAALLNLAWDKSIALQDERYTAGEWLSRHLEISLLTAPVVKKYALLVDDEPLRRLAACEDLLRDFLRGRHVADLLQLFPPPPEARDKVLAILRRQSPRLYSLANSHQAREGEAHLLVGVDTYVDARRDRGEGLCSGFLSALKVGDTAQVYVHKNNSFRLPADDSAAVIMIGPGTGVAPFRAFLEEREHRRAPGKNWLFFGERRRRDDFYYQTDWQNYLRAGLLTELDVAFSRDGGQKVYVQHKMRAAAQKLREWIDGGAFVYVCGDERHMAKSVDMELADIVGAHGGGDGRRYLETMRREGRYQRDVY